MLHQRRISVRWLLWVGFLTIVLLIGGFLIWGYFTNISGAVIASGQIEIASRNQSIEHIDGGTVDAVLVGNGDRVEAGDVLVRLDSSKLMTERSILVAKLWEVVARRDRLDAEFRGLDRVVWSGELFAKAEAVDAVARDILDNQTRLFITRLRAWRGMVAQLHEQIGQSNRRIEGLEVQKKAAIRILDLLGQELAIQRSLYENQFTPLIQVLALEREAAKNDGWIGDLTAKVAMERGRIAELSLQVLQLEIERVSEAEGDAGEVGASIYEIREKLAHVIDRLDRMEIGSPIGGIVHDMKVFSVGEVVKPGEEVARVVPDTGELIVIANLDLIDIDQVHAGQDVDLMFAAFPARTALVYEGNVRRISADALKDPQSGTSWYEIEIGIGDPIIPDDWPMSADETGAESLTLVPGMPVDAFIRTGDRSPLDYLVKPFTDYFQRALREE